MLKVERYLGLVTFYGEHLNPAPCCGTLASLKLAKYEQNPL